MKDFQRDVILAQRQELTISENYMTELYDWANRPVNLEIGTKQERDEDEKGHYILHGEMEKAIKEIKDKTATGDDDVPRYVLKLLEADGLKITTRLITAYIKLENVPSISQKLQLPERSSLTLRNGMTIAPSPSSHNQQR